MIGLIEEGAAADIVCVVFGKTFDTVSLKTLKEKLMMLMKYGLDEQILRWIENWLDYWVQRTVISGSKSS